MSRHTVGEFHVGIICALPMELTAVTAMLDEEYEALTIQDEADHNSYILGRMQNHNVALACLPAGVYGTNAAALVAKDMLRTFYGLRIGLLVGIAGAIPNLQEGLDIRLGDVVVSQPGGNHGGVVQYDLGKDLGDGEFVRKGMLNKPPTALLTALSIFKSMSNLRELQMANDIRKALDKHPFMRASGYIRPAPPNDRLLCADCISPQDQCAQCDNGTISRQHRPSLEPVVHYGLIASGNQVIKNAKMRDKIGQTYGALCVEMEAAGLVDEYPCLVIRGMSDYADSGKSDQWQKYAALTAAAFAKGLLRHVSMQGASQLKPALHILDMISKQDAIQKTIEAHAQKQEIRYLEEKHRDCHQIFKTSSYEAAKNINPDAVQGTCSWVLHHSKYREWLTSTKNDLIWVSADPGCGKSVLSKFLIESSFEHPDGQEYAAANPPHTICYFFFKENESQDNLSTALCAILHQLFSQQPWLIKHAMSPYFANGSRLQGESLELWRILYNAMRDIEAQPVTCVLDALDECRNTDRQNLITQLSHFYGNGLDSEFPTTYLKWFVTSRPYDDIQDGFEQIPTDLPSIRLRGEDENDQIREEINLVIRYRMDELTKQLKLSADKAQSITQQLLDMGHRTYLWLHLAISDIKETFRHSFQPEDEEIVTLPTSVEEAYEKILKRITDSARKQRVVAILRIIVGARRALSVSEMSLALGVATSKRSPSSLNELTIDKKHLENNIRHWCGLFVFIRHGFLYLIHQTAKEFLLLREGEISSISSEWKNCLKPLEVEKEMAKICVLFLCLKEFGISKIDSADKPTSASKSMFAFAAEHWANYVSKSEKILDEPVHVAIRSLYDTSSQRYKNWIPHMWKNRTFAKGSKKCTMNSIQLAAYNGHLTYLQSLTPIDQKELNAEEVDRRSILSIALEQGHTHVVPLLLEEGANPNGNQYSNFSPLPMAIRLGYEDLVEMLIKHGGSVNRERNEYAPLHETSLTGNVHLMQLLLQNGAPLDSKTSGQTPLYTASKAGHTEMVGALLERGAMLNLLSTGMSALYAASSEGHLSVAQLLINHGARIEGCGKTPLIAAAGGGHLQVVRLLLQHGADINFGIDNMTPLYAACEAGHLNVVETLLQKGAILDSKTGIRSPLYVASQRGHSTVVGCLLQRGAMANVCYGVYGNPLQAASIAGHFHVMELLLEHGADISAKGGKCGNALQAASAGGRVQIVQEFISKGANVNEEGGFYHTALEAAFTERHIAVIRTLLSKGADPNLRRPDSAPLLYRESNKGVVRHVQMLLDAKADPGWRTDGGDTALQAALHGGHVDVVKLIVDWLAKSRIERLTATVLFEEADRGNHKNVQALLNAGVDPDLRILKPITPLQTAVCQDHTEVARVLLEGGAKPHIYEPGTTPLLNEASKRGNVEVVEMLLDAGVDLNEHGGQYGTALQAAARHGFLDVVKLLLDKGADPNAYVGWYGTALQAAKCLAHEEISELLISRGAIERVQPATNAAKDSDPECSSSTDDNPLYISEISSTQLELQDMIQAELMTTGYPDIFT